MRKAKEAKKFARMFLNVVGLEAAQQGLKELSAVNALMSGSRDFREFLQSPQFTSEERAKVLGALKGRYNFSDNTVKFIAYISEKMAASLLGGIISHALSLWLEKKRRARAKVFTPYPIDTAYEARLRSSIERLTGRAIDIEYETDPSLMGGVLVKVGSTMFDSSIRGQLRLLKDELTKE
jgi:ATP synthase F1 delta subunit